VNTPFKIIKEIINKGPEKYYFISKGRNLIWALLIYEILGDDNIESLCERFGTSLNIEADFSEYLKDLASKKIRLIIADAVKDKYYQNLINEEKYNFLRTKIFYQHCKDIANERYNRH